MAYHSSVDALAFHPSLKVLNSLLAGYPTIYMTDKILPLPTLALASNLHRRITAAVQYRSRYNASFAPAIGICDSHPQR